MSSFLKPYTAYKTPQRIPDGEGGWTVGTIEKELAYLGLAFHETVVTATFRVESDFLQYDMIEIKGNYYKIISETVVDENHYKKVTLEKIDKPIHFKNV